jgi:hypothetical protein
LQLSPEELARREHAALDVPMTALQRVDLSAATRDTLMSLYLTHRSQLLLQRPPGWLQPLLMEEKRPPRHAGLWFCQLCGRVIECYREKHLASDECWVRYEERARAYNGWTHLDLNKLRIALDCGALVWPGPRWLFPSSTGSHFDDVVGYGLWWERRWAQWLCVLSGVGLRSREQATVLCMLEHEPSLMSELCAARRLTDKRGFVAYVRAGLLRSVTVHCSVLANGVER